MTSACVRGGMHVRCQPPAQLLGQLTEWHSQTWLPRAPSRPSVSTCRLAPARAARCSNRPAAAMGAALSWLASSTATPCLVDRATGRRIYETTPLSKSITTASHPTPTARARSLKSIQPFIKTYHIDASAAEKPVGEYATLQEFFTRRLKPGLRPLAAPGDDAVAVNPADSRCVVYESVDAAHRLWIKGQHFSVVRLMGPDYDSQDHWRHAALAINRLSPSDIHRLHASVSGRVVRIARRGTRFMGSQFAAVHSSLDVMTENDRLVMEFDSGDFGTVVQVMIGASEVGSVVPLVKEGQSVKKGDEVAVFEYGGSIMVTLFHQQAISFDDDLSRHSKRGCETLVTMGSGLGRATGRGCEHAPAGAPR